MMIQEVFEKLSLEKPLLAPDYVLGGLQSLRRSEE
jgi:hypothetical protein